MQFLDSGKFLRRCAVACLAINGSRAAAIIVNSILDSQPSYEIIGPDEASPELGPGIYGLIKTSEKPVPILHGTVLGLSRSFNGIQLQLGMSRSTGRREAIAIVDGRITIFSRHSTLKRPESRMQLGGAKGDVPIDPLTKSRFDLAPITNLEDVHFSETMPSKDQSLILVSVHQPSPMGEGATFALLMHPPAPNAKNAGLRLAASPMLINFEFLTPEQLNILFVSRPADADSARGVYSSLIANSLAHQRSTDNATTKKWREALAARAASLPISADKDRSRNTRWQPGFLPWLDLEFGEPVIPQYPVEILSRGGAIAVVQRNDPWRDINMVYVTGSSKIAAAPNSRPVESILGGRIPLPGGIFGRVESTTSRLRPTTMVFQSTIAGKMPLAPTNTLQGFVPFVGEERISSVLFKVNGRPYLAYQNPAVADSFPYFDIGQIFELDGVTKLNYVHFARRIQSDGQNYEHTLILSMIRHNKPYTTGLVFESDGVSLRIGHEMEINHRFQTAAQMTAQTLVYQDGLFYETAATEKDSGPKGDIARPLSLKPYLDFSHGQPIYLAAKQRISLIPGMSWLEFANSGHHGPSGIYREIDAATDRRKFLESVTLGELKGRPSDLQKQGPPRMQPLAVLAVTREKPEDEDSDQGPAIFSDFKISIFASYKSAHKYSEVNSTEFIIALGREKSQARAQVVSIEADFKQLVDVSIIRHRRGLKNNYTVLFFFRQFGKDKMGGGVYATSFILSDPPPEIEEYPLPVMKNTGGEWLTHDQMDPAILRNRLVFDANGGPIWIDDPLLDKSDKDFMVVRLGTANGRVRLGQLTANVNFDETVSDAEVKKSTISDWVVYFPDQISLKRKDLKITTQTKSENKKEREAREKATGDLNATFPALNEYLDHIVNEAQPPKYNVLLVEKEMKTQLLEAILNRFARRGGDFSYTNEDFSLYLFQPEATPVKYRQELVNIGRKFGKKLLFIDGRDLVNSQQLAEEDESSEDEEVSREKDHTSPAKKNTGVEEASPAEIDKDHFVLDGKHPPERFSAPIVRTLASEGTEKNMALIEQVVDAPRRVPMLIVMTPYEWRRLHDENPADSKAYMDQRFAVDARFLTSGWAVWSPKSSRAKPEIREIGRTGVSTDAVRVFDQLNQILLDAANPEKPRKHQIVIYPDELGPLMDKLILGRWASDSAAMNTPWNFKNSELALLRLPKQKDGVKMTQQAVFENYNGLEEIRKWKTPVLLAQLSDINQISRPESEADQRAFLLRDPSAGATASDLKISDPTEAEAEAEHKSRNLPHLLWLMATEGAKLQPTLRKDWTVREDAAIHTATIIYGTEGEFSRLKNQIGFESRFGNLLEAFEVAHLREPAIELRRQLVREIFSRPQVRILDLRFQVGDAEPKYDSTDLVSVLISRIEQQAHVTDQDPTSAFIRVYSLVQSFVSEDKTIRETRLVNKAAVERLLTRIFPTGLKPESQPPTHPINIVKDTTKAALAWQKAGYRGYADLKRQILELYYSQTESVQDAGRPVRFATIFFGPTSTGKSWLLLTLFNMLNLKPLDGLNPNYAESDYYFIKVHELTEESGTSSVEDTLLKAEHLLCHNPQAHIVFDDLHKAATAKLLKRIISWMSAIFDANKGMLSMRCAKEERREVPVMNMGLHITMNPTTDQKMRERVRGRDYLETEILAGLSKDDFILEGSFLARIPAKFNMERFPAGAKFATLINDTRKASQSEFISREAFVMVSPLAVQRLVDRFGEANAREFSSNATVALMQINQDLPRAPIYMVDLKNTGKRKLLDQDVPGFNPTGGAVEAGRPSAAVSEEVTRDRVKSAIQDIVTYRAVDGVNVGSMLDFTSFIVDGFRIHAYQIMLDGLLEDEVLNGSQKSRQHFMGEMLIAAFDSLVEWGMVPLNNLSLHPREFGWPSEGKIPEFLEALKERSEKPGSDKKFFRYNFAARSAATADSMSDSAEDMDKRILDVLSETAFELHSVMEDLMKAYFRVVNLKTLPSQSDWFSSLPDLDKPGTANDPNISELREKLYGAGQRMAAIYVNFTSRLFDADLLEHKMSAERFKQKLTPIGSYDQARLFLQAFDKAVVALPWDHLAYFAWKNMSLATQDMSLGHLPRFQHLLFKSEFSPYATVTPDSIFQSVTGNPLYKSVGETDRNARAERFNRDCRSLLILPDNILPARDVQGE